MNEPTTNAEEQELLRALRTLARDDERVETPPRVEVRLMRAFDENRTPRSHRPALFAPHLLKAATVFGLAAVGGYWLSGRGVEPPTERAAVSEPAVSAAWLSSDALTWLDPEPGSLQIVHVRVDSETLVAHGYAVGDPDGDGLVDLEVILGDDGLARGVRVAPATAVVY